MQEDGRVSDLWESEEQRAEMEMLVGEQAVFLRGTVAAGEAHRHAAPSSLPSRRNPIHAVSLYISPAPRATNKLPAERGSL